MMPKDFPELVQGVVTILVVCAFLYYAISERTFSDALIAGFSTALGYWLGSSQGSKAKMEMFK
jgi:hypothetical protein